MDRIRNQEIVKGDNTIKSELYNNLSQSNSFNIHFDDIKEENIYTSLQILDAELENNKDNLKKASLGKHQISYEKNIDRCEKAIEIIESFYTDFGTNRQYARVVWEQMIAHVKSFQIQEVNTLVVNAIGKAISRERKLIDKGKSLLEEDRPPHDDTTDAYKKRYVSVHQTIKYKNEILLPDVPKSLIKGNPKDYMWVETWGHTDKGDGTSTRSSEPFYENIFNPKEGIIILRGNYKDEDAKWEAGKESSPLYNSEILWNQYVHSAKETAFGVEGIKHEDFRIPDFKHKYFNLKECISCKVTETDTVAFLSSYIEENKTKIFKKSDMLYYSIL